VRHVPVDFGGQTVPVAFEGDRVYLARWLCQGAPADHWGVVLDVLDRATFRLIKRVEVAQCDRMQQDSISAIVPLPGYVVLGLSYLMPRQGRTNTVVLDAGALAVKARGFIGQEITRLKLWRGKLLACIPGQTSYRLDPESLSLITVDAVEARACAKGQAVRPLFRADHRGRPRSCRRRCVGRLPPAVGT
jgi:hypothetical protein